MENITVKTVPYFGDNYCYLVHCVQSGWTQLMDCGDAAPVVDVLDEEGWRLDSIFLTHFHADHSAGVSGLQSHFPGLKVFKPTGEDRLTMDGIELRDREEIQFGSTFFRAVAIPAHTSFCMAYYVNKNLFVGDALFSGGCGRLFEGTARDLLKAMDRLSSFAEETKVHVGHEYTLANLKFALSIEPDNSTLRHYIQKVKTLRGQGEFSTPTTIGLEKKINPFLRIDKPAVIEVIDPMRTMDRAERMGLLRRKKDNY